MRRILALAAAILLLLVSPNMAQDESKPAAETKYPLKMTDESGIKPGDEETIRTKTIRKKWPAASPGKRQWIEALKIFTFRFVDPKKTDDPATPQNETYVWTSPEDVIDAYELQSGANQWLGLKFNVYMAQEYSFWADQVVAVDVLRVAELERHNIMIVRLHPDCGLEDFLVQATYEELMSRILEVTDGERYHMSWKPQPK